MPASTDLPLVQKDFLPGYYDALLAEGVTDYEYERFVSDYRYGLLDSLLHVIEASSKADVAREDSVEFIRKFVGQVAAAAVDAGCEELIS